MRPYIIGIVLAGFISGCSSAPTSIAVLQKQMAAPGECVSGDCKNGYGTLRYPDGSEITANRVNGNMVAGNAEFRYSCLPKKTFGLTLNSAGRPASGTIVRCGDLLGMLESGGRTTFFTGTFQTISNSFTQEQVNTYKTGTYTDGNGVKWEGEFSYIPVRHVIDNTQWGKVATRKGSFIFMGSKIDAQLDEVVHGLYISEPVSPGSEIAFFKARPDYLAKLRSTFVSEREQDAAEREADARANRELFSNFVTFASATVVAYGKYKMEQAASNRAHMDSLNQVITGKKSPTEVNAQLPKGSQGKAGTPAQPMTVAEYRKLQGISSPSSSKAGANSNASGSLSSFAGNSVRQGATTDDSWRTCGAQKKCLVGDGYSSFCSGPFDPNKPMCKSECQMDSHVIYHDTTLSSGAYIPGDYKCPTGSCNVVNSCS